GDADPAARPCRGTDPRVPRPRPGDISDARAGAPGRRARRKLPMRLQRGERGRRRGFPRRPDALPGDRRRSRGDSRSGRRRSRSGSRRPRRGGCPGPPPDRGEGAGRVSVLIAIIGLASLILVHEAGHFFTALVVGMRPRRFYVGFPPAILKTKRNGIEYGVGAIPLGGYVKIPGMHRPAASDADAYFGRALRERPELAGPLQRLKRALAAEDETAARTALEELKRLAGADPPEGFERGLQEMEDGLSPQA